MLHANILDKRALAVLSDAEIEAVSGGTEILDIKFDLGTVQGSVGVNIKTGDVSGSLSTTNGNTTLKLEGSTDGTVMATVTIKF